MRDHLAADLAEAREPIGDEDEPVFVDLRDVARHIPAIPEGLGGALGGVEIACHTVGAREQKQAFLPDRKLGAAIDVDHLGAHAWHGPADRSVFGPRRTRRARVWAG